MKSLYGWNNFLGITRLPEVLLTQAVSIRGKSCLHFASKLFLFLKIFKPAFILGFW